MFSWAQEEIWNISSKVPRPPGQAMKTSTWLNIIDSFSDIVETCSSSPAVFQWCPLQLKLWGPLKLDCLLKMQLLTHAPLAQGCLPHTLNESFSQLVPDQDDLLILKLFLSQDCWIHKKTQIFFILGIEKLTISTHFYIC